MIRRTAPLAATLLLGGCMFFTPDGLDTEWAASGDKYMFTQLEILSLVNTHKTMGDHIASWITGKDCSTPKASRGDAYCVDHPGPPPPPQQVYCYASLGRPSCFAQAYNEGNDRLIGFVPASTPVR